MSRSRAPAPPARLDEPRLPRGYWPASRVTELLDATLVTTVEANLEHLSPGERRAVDELLRAGSALQDLAEDQQHRQALGARRRLQELHEARGRSRRTSDLLRLYELSQGPIATTLTNQLVPFLPVDGYAPGRNVYPWQIAADELNGYFERRPEARALL